MSLITTPGAANADSYATLAEATAYNAGRTFSSDWTDNDSPDQEAALKQAARMLDSSFRWTGAAVDDVQALTWPRSGMLTRNGFAIPTAGSTSIPQALKDAQSEFARQLLVADRTADNEAQKQGISSVKAGPVTVAFKASESSSTVALRDADVARMGPDFDYLSAMIPDAVRNLIPPSWYTRGTITPAFFFEVDR